MTPDSEAGRGYNQPMTDGLADFKERQKRGFKAAEVKIGDLNIISPDMQFAAIHEGKTKQTFDGVPGEEGSATGQQASAGIVRHTRPDTVTMWKPDAQGHFSPRLVPVTAIKQNLLAGFRSECGDCGGHHAGNPNDCPGREPVAVRRCPVCRKAIYDNMDLSPLGPTEKSSDPNEINDGSYQTSTPATRTKALLDFHIWAKHPQSARIMAIAPPSQPPKDMLESASSAGVAV